MGRSVKETFIRRPRKTVYAFLIDLRHRQHSLPGDFQNQRVTSASPNGVGAVLEYDVKLGRVLPGETVLTGALWPEAITENGHIGEIRWMLRYELEEQGEGTLVRVVSDYSVPGLVNKVLTSLLYGPAFERWHSTIAERLKASVESKVGDEAVAAMATTAATFGQRTPSLSR